MSTQKRNPEIIIEGDLYEIEKVFISELGYLMIRLYSSDKKIYVSHNLGNHNPEENIFKKAIDESRKKT